MVRAATGKQRNVGEVAPAFKPAVTANSLPRKADHELWLQGFPSSPICVPVPRNKAAPSPRQLSAPGDPLSRPPHTTFSRRYLLTMLAGQGRGPGSPSPARPPPPARRLHSNQLTTSRARLEKSPLGRGLRRNSSSRLPSTPPPTATPSALLRVFTVLTLARNSRVMSTAMATRTLGDPHPRRPAPGRPTSAAGDRGPSPAAGGPFRFRTPPPANGDARRKVPASAAIPRREEKSSGLGPRAWGIPGPRGASSSPQTSAGPAAWGGPGVPSPRAPAWGVWAPGVRGLGSWCPLATPALTARQRGCP